MNNNNKYDLIIIGAGLTGLALAYFLRESGKSILILEGRKRVGGRIYTKRNANQAPQEMGATWLSNPHTSLINILQELGIEVFEQVISDQAIYEPTPTSPPQLVQLPPNDNPSYRIANGTSTIIEKLQSYIADDNLHLNEKVISIQEHDDHISVQSEKAKYKANIIVSTLPPYLLNQTIDIVPSLPSSTTQIMKQTHTWMGTSIKISLSYAEPFWRDKGLSGTIFSAAGPLTEFYDHSDIKDKNYAMMGFINDSYFSISKNERLQLIMQQLNKYYGTHAQNYINYEEKIWCNDSMTSTPYKDHLLPHQNNGHAIYNQAYFNKRFYIAGAETSRTHAGYMDGAVSSAKDISQRINNLQA